MSGRPPVIVRPLSTANGRKAALDHGRAPQVGRRPAPGQRVELAWEPAQQDGYGYRAVRTWPAGSDPVHRAASAVPGDAHASRLTLTPDGEPG